jgi:PAS domain S-box-containing protein
MNRTIKILHLEDVESDSNIVKRELQKSGLNFEYLWVINKVGFDKALKDFLPDIILSDHSLPSFTSTDALKMVKETGKRIPFIVVTATMSEEFAVETMKTGVDDYLLKDRLQRLPNSIRNALDKVNSEIDKAKYYREIVKREKKFRELIENIADGIVLIDERGCLLYQSPSATRMTNYAAAESEGKVIYQFLHHDDITKATLLFEKVFLNPQTPIPFALRMLHKNGHYIWVEGTITNLLGDVSVKGLILNYRDITKKRTDERLLQKSEANLRTIFENTAISYVLTDKDFNIVSFNNLAAKSYKTDLNADIVEGKNLIDYLPPERKDSGRRRYELVLQGRRVNYEIDFTRGDGSVTWYNINIFPVHNDKKEILGIIVSS